MNIFKEDLKLNNIYLKNIDGKYFISFIQPLVSIISRLFHEKFPHLSISYIKDSFVKNFIDISNANIGFFEYNSKKVYLSKRAAILFNSSKLNNAEDSIIIEKEININDVSEKVSKNIMNSFSKNSFEKKIIEVSISKSLTRWIKWESLPWYASDEDCSQSQCIGVIFFVEDITKQEENIKSNKRLSKLNKMLEIYPLMFFHDLIGPISRVSKFVDLIKYHFSQKNIDDLYLKTVFKNLACNLDEVKKLSYGMMSYMKNGDMASYREPISFREQLEKVIRILPIQKDIEIIIELKSDVILDMNPIALEQLLLNIIINAIKHNGRKKHPIKVTGEPEGKSFYKFSIHNREVSNADTKKAFRIFYSRSSGGSGIGLMICKKIVSAHRGKIQIQSDSKIGTNVIFTLPIYNNPNLILAE